MGGAHFILPLWVWYWLWRCEGWGEKVCVLVLPIWNYIYCRPAIQLDVRQLI
jgi:hypothetical protein